MLSHKTYARPPKTWIQVGKECLDLVQICYPDCDYHGPVSMLHVYKVGDGQVLKCRTRMQGKASSKPGPLKTSIPKKSVTLILETPFW